MTVAQEKAIAKIRRLAAETLYDPATYEFKRFDVEDCGSFLSVVVETGMMNDEGTLAEVFARDRAHLFVGRRGGITYPVSNGGRYFEKRFEGYSILQAVCDQRI